MIAHIDEPTKPQRRPDPGLETARLSLSALRRDDLDGFLQVFASEACARMTHAVPHPLARDEAARQLEDMRATSHSHWAIRLDDHWIGLVSLTRTACGKGPDLNSFGPNLSVFIAPDHQGHGYAVEAIDGLLDWVKQGRRHRVIHAAHFADNPASARVLVAADFLYTGRRTEETSLAREGPHPALHMIRIL